MKGFWKKKLPSFLMALVLLVGLVPAASAASADIIYDVDAGDNVTFNLRDFSRLASFDYLQFTSYGTLDDYGSLVAYNKSNKKVTLSENDLEDMWFYYDEDRIDYATDCDLATLSFVANDNADGTLTLRFSLYRSSSGSSPYSGTLRINIDRDRSGSSRSNIVYEVDADKSVSFDRRDFKSYFEKRSSEGIYRMEFTNATGLDRCGRLYSYDYDGDKVYFDEDDIDTGWFYYSSGDLDDDDVSFTMDDLTFLADDDADGRTVTLDFTIRGDGGDRVTGSVSIKIGDVKSSSRNGDIHYDADDGDKVTFDEDDFWDLFEDKYNRSTDDDFSYVVFDDSDNLDACGKLYADDYNADRTRIRENDLSDYYFYYDHRDMRNKDTDFYLEDMYFQVDDDADDETVTLDFTLYGNSSRNPDTLEGTLTITIGDGRSSSSSTKKGDINYAAKAGAESAIDPDDFNNYFEKAYGNYDFKYLTFTDSKNLSSSNGYFYYRYGRSSQQRFTANTLADAYFYYDEDEMPNDDEDCYPLADLSFVASDSFKGYVSLDFRAYYSNTRYVDGTVVFSTNGSGSTSSPIYYLGNIRYSTTPGKNIQLNANDLARLFTKNYPGFTMQYVTLTGVPASGSLYYNYYGASKYGTPTRAQVTTANARNQEFYLSPASTSQYALTELTYVPSGSNYCTAIPFTAHGTGSRSVSGAILISVTSSAVSEVYSVTTKGTPISLSANSIYNAVLNATGSAPSSIQLVGLPSSTQGSLYLSGSYTPANVTTRYTYGSGSTAISQLQFLPNANYTGSVELPYVALNSNGAAIASGMYSIGVVSSVKRFSDVSSSTWCYKYVTELSDAGVIDGYTGGAFKANNTITYGAALKLIMLAAGYPEQTPTGGNVFSGYLTKAKADGLVSGSVNLSKPITRLAMAEIAAKAMKLNTTNLPAVKPFTDTSNVYVQALNAAGIVEGYFANGTSTFKPNNTLTRGQVSAIVWRMRNYNK